MSSLYFTGVKFWAGDEFLICVRRSLCGGQFTVKIEVGVDFKYVSALTWTTKPVVSQVTRKITICDLKRFNHVCAFVALPAMSSETVPVFCDVVTNKDSKLLTQMTKNTFRQQLQFYSKPAFISKPNLISALQNRMIRYCTYLTSIPRRLTSYSNMFCI